MTDSPGAEKLPITPGARRSKRKKRPSYKSKVQEILHQRLAVRVIAGAVVALGLLVTYVLWSSYDGGINSYLDIGLYDDQNSVLYAVGYPAAVRVDKQSPWVSTGLSSEAGVVPGSTIPVVEGKPLFAYREWAYGLPLEAQGQFSFGPDGQVTRVACFQLQAQAGACPPMLEVSVGDYESAPYDKLGDPDREQISGMSKLLYYDRIGVQYSLAQRRVYRIDLTKRTGGLGAYWSHFIRKVVL